MLGVIMADDENTEVLMAECGACRAVIPVTNSTSECGVKFSGSLIKNIEMWCMWLFSSSRLSFLP